MADVPLVLAAVVLQIDAAAIGHLLLREVEDVAVRVVGGDAGEGPRARPLHPVGVWILAAHAVEHRIDVLHLDAEMVEAGGPAGLARIDVEPDIAVAHRDGPVDLALGGALHAEQRFIEARQQGIFLADDGDVIDLGEHGRYPAGWEDSAAAAALRPKVPFSAGDRKKCDTGGG
jgi:hypothetical protein